MCSDYSSNLTCGAHRMATPCSAFRLCPLHAICHPSIDSSFKVIMPDLPVRRTSCSPSMSILHLSAALTTFASFMSSCMVLTLIVATLIFCFRHCSLLCFVGLFFFRLRSLLCFEGLFSFRFPVPVLLVDGDKPSQPVAHFSTSAWLRTEGRVPC